MEYWFGAEVHKVFQYSCGGIMDRFRIGHMTKVGSGSGSRVVITDLYGICVLSVASVTLVT